MGSPSEFIDNASWRADLIARQGFNVEKAPKLSTEGLKQLIDCLAYVQLDSIKTVERAHHCILFARNTSYTPDLLHKLAVDERQLFENWTHDACTLPVEHFPLIRLRFAREQARLSTSRWWSGVGSELPELCKFVRDEVETHGPLPMRHFTDLKGSKPNKPGMWEWSPIKTAVESMWRTGQLAVAERINFNKVYDLTQNLIPKHIYDQQLTDEVAIENMCLIALERLGYTTVKEIADFWGFLKLNETKACLDKLLQSGRVEPSLRETSKGEMVPCYFLPEAVGNQTNVDIGLRILSPFDPLARNRVRLESMFGFEYRFEAFTPQPKRQFGYYVFPVIEKTRFVGRLDMALGKGKEKDTLFVRRFWPEVGTRKTKVREAALKRQLKAYSKFCGASKLDFSEGYWD